MRMDKLIKVFADTQEFCKTDPVLKEAVSYGMEHTKKVIDSIEKGKSIGVFIGPEGGFDPSEVEKLSPFADVISLGSRIW